MQCVDYLAVGGGDGVVAFVAAAAYYNNQCAKIELNLYIHYCAFDLCGLMSFNKIIKLFFNF